MNLKPETFISHCITFFGFLIILNMSFLKISLFIQNGDIETNLGPTYSILKSLTGRYHQGDIAMFGETAGLQCLCNSIYAICWSMIRRVGLWNKQDLDHILA